MGVFGMIIAMVLIAIVLNDRKGESVKDTVKRHEEEIEALKNTIWEMNKIVEIAAGIRNIN